MSSVVLQPVSPGGSYSSKHMVVVFIRVSIVIKIHHNHSNSYKRKHLIGTGLQFGCLVHYKHSFGSIVASSESSTFRSEWSRRSQGVTEPDLRF